VCKRRQVNVDLHASITLREFGIQWDIDGMCNRATSFPLAGRQVSCLCHDDLMLVLCANGAKDGWDGLDRVCDVAALIRNTNEREGINWERMFAVAEQAGMTRMLAVGLWLARELFSSPLPEGVEARVQSDTATQRIGSHLLDRLLSKPSNPDSRVRRAWLYLQLRERWHDRARCCLEHLRPGVGDWAALPLPAPLRFLHYPIRPLRLISRYGIELFQRPGGVP
ncbi:MAG TPA: nucleotidyltransferase family protein, partial [Tepidisphaeraceae bacterium]|nr:nucleotidyltransferase family protein [Tepidisphaeraceae bacterium]